MARIHTIGDTRMVSYKFEVPFVQGKARPRFAKGHAYTPESTVYYEDSIKNAFYECAGDIEPVPKDWPVLIAITVHKKIIKKSKSIVAQYDYTKPDLDNVAKLVMDALNGAAYTDDKQVIGLTIKRDMRKRRQTDMTSVTVCVPKHWDIKNNEVMLWD